MKPTNKQISFLETIAKEIQNFKFTNDITSPTHNSDTADTAERIVEEYLKELEPGNDLEYFKKRLSECILGILWLTNNVTE